MYGVESDWFQLLVPVAVGALIAALASISGIWFKDYLDKKRAEENERLLIRAKLAGTKTLMERSLETVASGSTWIDVLAKTSNMGVPVTKQEIQSAQDRVAPFKSTYLEASERLYVLLEQVQTHYGSNPKVVAAADSLREVERNPISISPPNTATTPAELQNWYIKEAWGDSILKKIEGTLGKSFNRLLSEIRKVDINKD